MKDNGSDKKIIQHSLSVDVNTVLQPPTPWCSTVKWGAHHLYDISLTNSIIYSCFPLTDYYTNIGNNTAIQGRINDFVAITSNSVIRFDAETRAIKETAKYACCAGVYIPTQDAIVAVSATTSHFIFIRPEDMKHPIESEYRSMQFPCFHITYLKKSSTLVTSGSDIRIWNLKFILPSRNLSTIKPQINISLRATIETGFEFNYLNPPTIDYLNELIILPKGTGFSAYNVDGQFIKEMSKLSTTPQTLSSFLPNENFETDKEKNKKLINKKSSQNLYYQSNMLSSSQNAKTDKTNKKDKNQDDNSVLITADSEYGVCEWNPTGTIKKRHTSGNSKIIAIRLINKSFFLYIDIKNNIYIVDMLARTPRMFLVATTKEKPLSLVLFRTKSVASAFQFGLTLCINTSILVYQVVVPWKLFAPSLIKPVLIKLCPRRNHAARIQVQTANSDLYLISPKTAQPITSAAPNNPKKIIGTLYDRGMLIKEPRDQLMIVVENGEIVCFNTSDIPCQTITTIDLHACAVFLAYANKSVFSNGNNIGNINHSTDDNSKAIENDTSNNTTEKEDNNENNEDENEEEIKNNGKELCYCVVTLNGEIYLCDYNTFQCKKRFIIQTGIVTTANYDMVYGTVIMCYINMLLRFDIQNGVILEKLKQVPSGTVTCLEKGILLIGYESGKITMFRVKEKKMEIMKTDGVSYHTAAVTGFSFGSTFFLSSSLDQTIKIWSLKGETVGVISLPLPLYGIEIYNGKRDILVGTDKEVMVIEGKSIFIDEFERKDDILDNYNEKDDELSNDAVSPLEKQEEEKQAFLVSRKRSEQESEMKNRKEETKFNTSNNIVYINNQSNRSNRNQTETSQKKEIDEETRKKIIEEMTKITSNSTLSTRIAEREKMLFAQAKEKIENEYKREKEQRGYNLEEQELALRKRKEETILRRKREQEEQERKERERKEKEERERREKKEREEREKREREEQERREREEQERKEREERERKEREERERLEREEQERLEREEQERLEREEQERRHREEEEKHEREERERRHREEEEEKHEREERERLEREEQERKHKEEEEQLEKERLEKERLENERLEKERQAMRIAPPEDEPPSEKTPRMNQIEKQKNEGKQKKAPKEKKKKKSKSPSPEKQPKSKQKDENEETQEQPEANVVTYPNALIEDTKEKENLPQQSLSKTTNNAKGKKSKSKGKTDQSKETNDAEDDNENEAEDESKANKLNQFKKELIKWISSDGKVFAQTKKGDWTDEQSRIFKKQANGRFIAPDDVFWTGPSVQKGRFVTAKGSKSLDSVGQRFINTNNEKIYTFLGNDKWSDSDGNIYTKRKDGKFATDNTRRAKVWGGPDGNGFFEKMNRPKQIVGAGGKIFKLNKKGEYSSGSKDEKPNENGSFVTKDGVLMRMIDPETFLGSDGNVYRSDGNGNAVNSEGKSYEIKLPPPPPTPPPEPKPEPVKEKEPETQTEENQNESKNTGKGKKNKNKKKKADNKKANAESKNTEAEAQNKETAAENKNKEAVIENKKAEEQNKEKTTENKNKEAEVENKKKEDKNKEADAEVKNKEVEIEKVNDEKVEDNKDNDKKEEEKVINDEDKNEKKDKKTKKKKKKSKKEKREEEEKEEEEKEEKEEEEKEEKEEEEKEEEEKSEKDEEDQSEKESESEKDDEKEEEDESEKESQKDEEDESEKDEESEKEAESENEDEEENDDDDDESENKAKKAQDKGKLKSKGSKDTKSKDNNDTKAKVKDNSKAKDETKSKDKSKSKSKPKAKNASKNEEESKTNDDNQDIAQNESKDIEIINQDENDNSNNNDESNENKMNEANDDTNNNNEEEAEETENINEQIENNNNNEEEEIENNNNEDNEAIEDNNNDDNEANENNDNQPAEDATNNENELDENSNNENNEATEDIENNDDKANENNNDADQDNETAEDDNNNDNNEATEDINNNNEEEVSVDNNNENEEEEVSVENNNENEATEDIDNNNDNEETEDINNNNNNEEEAAADNDNNENEAGEDNDVTENDENVVNHNEEENNSEINDNNGISQADANEDSNAEDRNEEVPEESGADINESADVADNINENEATAEDQIANNNEAEEEKEEVNSTENSNNDTADENSGANEDDENNIKLNEEISNSNIDVFKPGEVYKSNDGSEYKKTDDSTFVDQEGKTFKLDENGDYTAEDGTMMPLSKEELFYAEPNGSVYRPLNESEDNKIKNRNNEPKWIDSEGKIFAPSDETKKEKDEENEKEDVNNDYYYSDEDEQNPFMKKLVADDGTVWNGPNPASGKFGGKNIKKTPVQWVQNDGVVFIPSNKENSEWTNSENKKYAKEKESDPHFVRIEDDNKESESDKKEKEIWEGPVVGKGHWVAGNGNVIDSDKGIWVAPDKKVYTAVKTGYVQNDNGRLYKPFITSQGLVNSKDNTSGNPSNLQKENKVDDGNVLISDDGKDLLKIGEKEGQFISNSGEIYTSIEDGGKEWVDNYGVVYRPHHEGNYLVSDETKQKWQGPPFFNNRKINSREFEGFKHPPVKLTYPAALTLPKRDVVYTNYEVNIGKRPSTPLYKVPPLRYPPNLHSKYKPFRFRPKTPPGDSGYFYRKFNDESENPRRNRLRILNQHAIPPPNIVIDERQVIRMIERGQRQLIPLLRRIAIEHPSKKLAIEYLKRLDEQASLQNTYYEDDISSSYTDINEDDNINQKYKGKFNIKFNLDLDTVAPTPINNLLSNGKGASTFNVKSPTTKQQTKSARPFVHYNNVLNPINNDQDYLNLYINRTKGRTKRRNDDDDDRYLSIDNRYSSNDFYQSQKKDLKVDERMRATSVHNAAPDKQYDPSILAQRANKPKLVIPQSARRHKKP